jgi:hypothetical protein
MDAPVHSLFPKATEADRRGGGDRPETILWCGPSGGVFGPRLIPECVEIGSRETAMFFVRGARNPREVDWMRSQSASGMHPWTREELHTSDSEEEEDEEQQNQNSHELWN